MATEPGPVLPFHDPFDEILSIHPSSFFDENLTFDEVLLIEDQGNSLNGPDHQAGSEFNDVLDLDDPLSDPFIWDLCNGTDDDVTGNYQSCPSDQIFGERCNLGVDGSSNCVEECSFPEANPMPLAVFSVSRSQYDCAFCQRLREVTHTNGIDVKRLEIHGNFGLITHVVLQKYDCDSSFESQEYQLYDFHRESIYAVKQFLIQYFDTCKREGYNLLQDPLSAFYEALCVGMNEDVNPDDFLRSSPEHADDFSTHRQEMFWQPEGATGTGDGSTKITLAVQRARTGKLELKDFIDYFDLPIEKAAQKMNICATVMKKICRRNGVPRWPYRKIRSIKNKISKRTEILTECGDYEEKAGAMADVHKYQQELDDIYAAFSL